jgi:transcriptional regulator with XRE-family HTH domain
MQRTGTARRIFVREWRKHRGLTQEALAARVGVSQETISRLERGSIAYTQSMLEALADALACEPADLIMRDPSRADAIWTIWDQIPVQQRDQAAKVLEAFVPRRKAS